MAERVLLKRYEEKLTYLTPPHAPSLVVTLGAEGNPNIGAFEQTMLCSNFPPCITIAVSPKADTLANVHRTKEFTLGFPSPRMVDQVMAAGEKLPPNESEFDLAELTPVESEIVNPPRIAECQVNFECVLQWSKQAGDHFLVVGRVVVIDVDAALLREDKVERRCGLDAVYYATSGVFFTPGNRITGSAERLVSKYEAARGRPGS